MGNEDRPEKRCPDRRRDGCCLWCRWDSCRCCWVCFSRPCHGRGARYEGEDQVSEYEDAVAEDGCEKEKKDPCREKKHDKKPDHDKDCWFDPCLEEERGEEPEHDQDGWCNEKHRHDPCS